MQSPLLTSLHVFQKINRKEDSKPQTSYSFLPTASASPFCQPDTRFQDYSNRITNSRTFKDVALLIAANHNSSNLRFNSGPQAFGAMESQEEIQETWQAARSPQISATSLFGQLENNKQNFEGKVSFFKNIASNNLQHLKLPIPPTHSKTSLDAGFSRDEVFEIAESWKALPIERWLDEAMQAKEPALHLQNYLAVCSQDEIRRCIHIVQSRCCQLLTHHLGCYILVQLIFRSEGFAKYITSVIFNHFELLLKNENASRAMQALAKNHEPFRKSVLKSFHQQPRYYISSISAVFLFCSLIQSCKSQKEYTLIRETLFSDLNLLVTSRFYKKALVTFSENCTEEDLDLILKLVTSDGKDVPSALEDKYLTHVFRVCIMRGNDYCRQLFKKFITGSPRIFEARKCLKMMLFRLSENLPEYFASQDTNKIQISREIVLACRYAVTKYASMISSKEIEVFSTRYEVWNLLAFIGMGIDLGVKFELESTPTKKFLSCIETVLQAPQH